nr:helitron helicase-like domain-containing protein [Tanacetum cinerariifolium]
GGDDCGCGGESGGYSLDSESPLLHPQDDGYGGSRSIGITGTSEIATSDTPRAAYIVDEYNEQDDCSTTETTSTNNVGPVDVSSSGGCVPDANITGFSPNKLAFTALAGNQTKELTIDNHCFGLAVANNVLANDPVTCDMNPTGHRRHMGPPIGYVHLGTCDQTYQHYGARFWYEERIKNNPRNARPTYHRCCMGRRVVLRTYKVYP